MTVVPTPLSLHDLHASAGAVFGTIGDREVPLSYGDPAAEHAAVRQGCGLLDRSDRGVLEVTGRDRAAFLHALLSNEVKALAPGQGCGAALLDVHGKVQALLTILVLEERILMLTAPGQADRVAQDLDRYLFSEKASFRNVTGESILLVLAGAEAPAVAARAGGSAPPETAWSHLAGTIQGVDVRLVRGGSETGAAEVWVLAPADRGAELWRALVAAGARPVGESARESLRVEAGTPVEGRDVDGGVLLPEIPFEHLVSHTKGCYLGQEVVVRIRDRGHVNRRLCGLLVEADAPPPAGAPVRAGGAEVGAVTSGTWSFDLGRPIALAFVRREHAEPGSGVTVDVGGESVPARVSALPFTR